MSQHSFPFSLPPVPDFARRPEDRRRALALVLILLALIYLVGAILGIYALVFLGGIALLLAAAGYLVWQANPTWTLSIALLLSPLAGNWALVGIPGPLAPDRWLAIVGVASILLRAPGARDLPRLRPRAAYLGLFAASLWAMGSALEAGTLFDRTAAFRLLERFGFVPFLVLVVAPAAFATKKQRDVLLGCLVAFGAYLSLTALFETVGLRELVFPTYINDPDVGIHVNRARGPFVEAATNGFALFACSAAAVIAARSWRRPAMRQIAWGVAVLCIVGVIFTLTRQAWLGAIVAGFVTVAAFKEIRRYALPVVAAAALAATIAVVAVPGFSEKFNERRGNQGTVWERENTNQAAINMIEHRPLLGFGWTRYVDYKRDYFELSEDRPLSGTGRTLYVHNLFLLYGSELGLVGLTLWIFGLGLVLAGPLCRRGPPELLPWRMALAAVITFYLVVSNFVYPVGFSLLIVAIFGAVVRGGDKRNFADTG